MKFDNIPLTFSRINDAMIDRRPLITFPMTQEDVRHFNLARKYKINQQILDGFLDPSEAITAPSVFVCSTI